MKHAFSVVGQPLPKIDAWAKVTGETRYADDLVLPRLAYGKLLRSAHAHARIRSIDTTQAAAVPGVYAVITGRDRSKALQPPLSRIRDLEQGV